MKDVANPGWVRPPRIYLGTIVLGVAAHLVWHDQLVPGSIGVPAGSLLVVAAVALYSGAVRAFKAAGTPVPGNQAATAIVRTGPYRFSRNPIYLAFSLMQLGLALLVNSSSLLVTLLPALALMASVVIPREERYLGQRFPAEYAAYTTATRRWF